MPSNRISRRRFIKDAGNFAAAGVVGSLIPFGQLRAADLPRPGEADWPRYGHDLHNTRFNSKEKTIGPGNVERLKLKWKFDTLDNFPIQVNPTVIGDTLFFGAGGYYYSLDSITGKMKWKYEVGEKSWIDSNKVKNQGVRSSCEYVDGRIYFGTGLNNVHCLDAVTGKEIWKTNLSKDGQTEYSPVVFNGKVFMGYSGPEPKIFCLDAETGAIRWRWKVNREAAEGTGGGSLWTSGAIDEQQNVIFNGTGSNSAYAPPGPMLYTNSLVAQDADTGELLWAYQAHPQDAHDLDFCVHPMVFDAVSPPRFRGDVRRCVAAANKANMVCLNRHTGELYWKVSVNAFAAGTGGPKLDAAAVAYNTVYVQAFAPINIEDEDEMKQEDPTTASSLIANTSALHAYNGEIQWMVPNLGRNSSPLAVANGVLYQGIQSPAKMEALDAKNGRRLWEYLMPSPYRGGASIANGAVYTSNGEPLRGQLTRGTEPVYSVYCFTVDGK
ncbi:MAG: PQQ-binding-like beta-propeller repeat protein [Acidobacteria bacterium]|nr:PQQ-binding-like beta-propeller repeat protein [Acidobacteriota bacterium]